MTAKRGSLTTRLARLEDRVESRTSPPAPPRDEEGWLELFEEGGRDGLLDHEPDFPRALALFRDELARARASTDPSFDPPVEFMPQQRLPHIRIEFWRSKYRFPELCAAADWLFEMLGRLDRGIPPVAEAEFAELAKWFAAHDAALHALSLPSELLDVGGGRQTCCGDVRYDLAKGPRADGSGRLAEEVRQLKARYGARLTAP